MLWPIGIMKCELWAAWPSEMGASITLLYIFDPYSCALPSLLHASAAQDMGRMP